ncbi:peroxiredoxin [Dolosicoccus paucivorans]|uniref:Peroxiredoxin n=1 Tax=Dolosicoccus paucivorans TaxID=84521 RepID=A0A2N6SPS0_9LACT|nr:OsmC family protein [Dolosicoccus paucivorans]PMC59074.1 peroxiredoxin [Dolosicoccus paucivorans]
MKETFKVISKKTPTGLQVESTARGFKLTMDEPEELGGTNTGMNPVEALLCALGSCQTIVAYAFAKAQGIDLEEFHVELEGDLDPDGFMGLADVRNGFQEIRYSMHFKSMATQEELESFAQFIESKCPVGDCLENGVPLKLTRVVNEK